MTYDAEAPRMWFRLVLASLRRKKLQQLREHAAYSIHGGRLLSLGLVLSGTQLKLRCLHLGAQVNLDKSEIA